MKLTENILNRIIAEELEGFLREDHEKADIGRATTPPGLGLPEKPKTKVKATYTKGVEEGPGLGPLAAQGKGKGFDFATWAHKNAASGRTQKWIDRNYNSKNPNIQAKVAEAEDILSGMADISFSEEELAADPGQGSYQPTPRSEPAAWDYDRIELESDPRFGRRFSSEPLEENHKLRALIAEEFEGLLEGITNAPTKDNPLRLSGDPGAFTGVTGTHYDPTSKEASAGMAVGPGKGDVKALPVKGKGKGKKFSLGTWAERNPAAAKRWAQKHQASGNPKIAAKAAGILGTGTTPTSPKVGSLEDFSTALKLVSGADRPTSGRGPLGQSAPRAGMGSGLAKRVARSQGMTLGSGSDKPASTEAPAYLGGTGEFFAAPQKPEATAGPSPGDLAKELAQRDIEFGAENVDPETGAVRESFQNHKLRRIIEEELYFLLNSKETR